MTTEIKNAIEVIEKEIKEAQIKYGNDLKLSYIEVSDFYYELLIKNNVNKIMDYPIQKCIVTTQTAGLTKNSCKLIGNGYIKFFSILGINI